MKKLLNSIHFIDLELEMLRLGLMPTEHAVKAIRQELEKMQDDLSLLGEKPRTFLPPKS